MSRIHLGPFGVVLDTFKVIFKNLASEEYIAPVLIEVIYVKWELFSLLNRLWKVGLESRIHFRPFRVD